MKPEEQDKVRKEAKAMIMKVLTSGSIISDLRLITLEQSSVVRLEYWDAPHELGNSGVYVYADSESAVEFSYQSVQAYMVWSSELEKVKKLYYQPEPDKRI